MMRKNNWGSLGAARLSRRLLLLCVATFACAVAAAADPVATLRAKYAALEAPLRQNQFERPLLVYSAEAQSRLQGEVYAIVDYPFGVVTSGLNNPDHWCDVMLLHINTKYCHALAGPSGTTLRVHIGKKTPEELADAPRVDFQYRVVAATPEYLDIALDARDGPLGTSDYRIVLEAMALPNAKTFLHLSYAYTANFAGRLAMQTYLATIGRDKVGFTATGSRTDGQTEYIGGMRGLVERNTMRYYLAIDSFLGAVDLAPAGQLEQRLQSWFTAVEQYPRQLHDVERGEYLEMKRAEHLRQQTVR